MDLCRICLFKTESSLTVFSEAKNGQKISEILEHFASIQIEEDDGLPLLICPSCETQINNFIDFQTLIRDSNVNLKQMYLLEDPLLVAAPLVILKEEPNTDFKSVNINVVKQEEYQAIETKPNVKKKRIKRRDKTFSCPGCDKAFRYECELVAHAAMHTGNERYRCEICQKGFVHKTSLKAHRYVHSTLRPFECEICGKTYKQKGALSIHFRNSHTKQESATLHSCEQCGKSFRFPSQLTLHLAAHNSDKKFICEFCSKEFAHPYNLKRHLKKHEPGGTSVQCSVCGKTLANRKSLSQHLKTHSDEMPLSCDICQKRFKFRTILRNHMEIHKDVKKYVCKICEKRFSFSSVLFRHMRMHSGEVPFKCHFCPKMFRYSQHLLSHAKKCHSREDEEKPDEN